MSDSLSDPPARRPAAEIPAVTRRGFLKGVALPAAAIAAAPALAALVAGEAEAKRKKVAPIPLPEVLNRLDLSVAHTAEERAALERQWKQMLETLDTLRKAALPVGTEFATGALAPRRLRRREV
jgi:hypothetical protein